MAGENPEDPRSGQDDEFLSKSKWQRFQILIMGPVMNSGAGRDRAGDRAGARAPACPRSSTGRPSWARWSRVPQRRRAASSRPDRLLTVGGEPVATRRAAQQAIGMRPSRDIVITLDRGGRTLTVSAASTADRYEVGEIGVLPDTSPYVQSVTAGDPADRGAA